MKKLLLLLILPFLFFIPNSYASDSLIFSAGYIPHGHSEDDTQRCINTGYAARASYEKELFDYSKYLTFSGGLQTIYSNYETANRKKKTNNQRRKRREHSFNAGLYVKPIFNIYKFSLYGVLGGGIDYMDSEHGDISYFFGPGIDFHISEKLSLGFSAQKLIRDNGSSYTYQFADIKFYF